MSWFWVLGCAVVASGVVGGVVAAGAIHAGAWRRRRR